MKGITLNFEKRVQTGSDAFNNPITSTETITVEDCLVAPIIEATNEREQQAIEQSRDQIYIHIPKTYDGDLSGSELIYYGKVFKIDNSSVPFMKENTPTRWNRYFRGESINA